MPTKTMLKRAFLTAAPFVNRNFLYMPRLGMACSRGALNAVTRRLDPAVTRTWEFSAFSQNGEDGIVDHLCGFIREPNDYFVDIGASDGLENSSSYLAIVKRYAGLMVEGDPFKSANARRFLQPMNWGVQHLNVFVTLATVDHVVTQCRHPARDFFSLDIDGIHFYVGPAYSQLVSGPKLPVLSTTRPSVQSAL